MSSIYYKNTKGNFYIQFFKSKELYIIISFVSFILLTISVLIYLNTSILLAKGLMMFLIFISSVLLFLSMLVLLLFFSFFIFNNNARTIRLKMVQNKIRKYTIKMMVDNGLYNSRKNSIGIEVGDVCVDFSNVVYGKMRILIEIKTKVDDFINSIQLINSNVLVDELSDFIVYDYEVFKNGRYIIFTCVDSKISYKITINNINDIKPVNNYTYKLDNRTYWNLSKSPHMLVSGVSGSGKSYFLYYLLLQFLILKVELIIIDPKRSDLYSLKGRINAGIFSEKEDVIKSLNSVISKMIERQELISKSGFSIDFSKLNLTPIVVIIDELGALVSTMDNKERKEFEQSLKNIILKGRSSGINVILTSQQMNSNNIPTEIRDQCSIRILFGKSSSENKRMVFGSVDFSILENRNFITGTGIIGDFSKGDKVYFFESPDLSRLGNLKKVFECI